MEFNSKLLSKQAMSGYSRLMQIMSGQVPSIHTFGIMSVDNPQNQPLSEPDNQLRRDEFKVVLKKAHYGYVQHNGVYDRWEKAFFIMNVSQAQLAKWCDPKNFDQESYIFGEVDHDKNEVDITLFEGSTPISVRRVVLYMENGVQNYYSEFKGRKFQIPFFDDNYAPTDKGASNLPLGVPFQVSEVDTPENAEHLATILKGNESLRKDATGKTAGMCNYFKRGHLLQCVRNLTVK